VFSQLQVCPLINYLAVILGILCLVGSLYLTYAAHHFKTLLARDCPVSYHRVQDIRRLAQVYGSIWYLLMGISWPIPVVNRLRGRNWWPAVYSHAEWVFRVAKWFDDRESK